MLTNVAAYRDKRVNVGLPASSQSLRVIEVAIILSNQLNCHRPQL